MRIYAILFLVLFSFLSSVYAQSAPTPKPTPNQTVSSTAPEPERFLNKDIKTQIFEIKYRDPMALAKVLRGLSSEERGTQITPDKDFKTITVRDYPENITVMERAVTKLDVPEKIPANLEVQLHLVAASRTGKESGQIPKSISDVITQLEQTLQYRSYRYITGILNRVQSGKAVESSGTTDSIIATSESTEGSTYAYKLSTVDLNMDASGSEVVEIKYLHLGIRYPLIVTKKDGSKTPSFREALIETSISLKEGEKVVVGTANIGTSDDAIILIVSVKKAN